MGTQGGPEDASLGLGSETGLVERQAVQARVDGYLGRRHANRPSDRFDVPDRETRQDTLGALLLDVEVKAVQLHGAFGRDVEARGAAIGAVRRAGGAGRRGQPASSASFWSSGP